MSNLSDLTNSLQENLKQQADNTRKAAENELSDFVNDIRRYLTESKKQIKSDIDEQNRQSRQLLLTSWKLAAITVILILGAAQGVVTYQGKLIETRWKEIGRQNDTLQHLKVLTWGIDLVDIENKRFLVLPKDHTHQIAKETWDERQVIPLRVPEE